MLIRDKVSVWYDVHTTHKLHTIGKMLNFVINQVAHIVTAVVKRSNFSKDREQTTRALLRV
jgi:hypothetical protein